MFEVNKRNQTHAVWQARIKEWEESKLSLRAYCLRHQISPSTFYYWKNLFRKEMVLPSARFIPVRPSPVNPLPSDTAKFLQVKLFNGMVIQLPINLPEEKIAKLIQALGKQYD